MRGLVLLAALAGLAGCTDLGEEADPPAGTFTSFLADVSPILTGNCVACHGAGGYGGLDLSTHAGVMAGGASGPAVVAGDPEASRLVQRISATDAAQRMPLGGQLAAAQILIIRHWIEEGAEEN
ncbi:MAG: c-type cytochrome domain-containing protein [bacterium]|jgi:mono/diheme cytochrome c family protein|nr:c-type cytochrome domain-containing protein [bacterium]